MCALAASLAVAGLALAQAPAGMPTRVVLGPRTYPADAITIENGRVVIVRVSGVWEFGAALPQELRWDGFIAPVTEADVRSSDAWIRANSVLDRTSIRDGNLFWNGAKVDAGNVRVERVFEAIPWQGGILCRARTSPRRGIFDRWPFKGSFIEAPDLEPYSALFFDPTTLKGEDHYLNSKVERRFFVFPVPGAAPAASQ
jgi:hypothetical protein